MNKMTGIHAIIADITLGLALTIAVAASRIAAVQHTRHLPDRDRLSVLTAMIVLAYALTRVLDLPSRVVSTTIFGSALGFDLNGTVMMMLVVAGLISAGADTLVRSHPHLAGRSGASTILHWILPGAAALVLGAVLNRTPDGPLVVAGPGPERLDAHRRADRRVRDRRPH